MSKRTASRRTGAKTVTVYHFTREQHLPHIMRDGVLTVTEMAREAPA